MATLLYHWPTVPLNEQKSYQGQGSLEFNSTTARLYAELNFFFLIRLCKYLKTWQL